MTVAAVDPGSLDDEVRRLDGRLESALAALQVPAFLVDVKGRMRWLNPAALEIVGDAVGRPYVDVVTRGDRASARTVFSRKVLGTSDATEVQLTLLTPEGRRVLVEITSAAVRDGDRVVGVFGLARPLGEPAEQARTDGPRPMLTSRQLEVLRLLAAGRTTNEIAATLGLSIETVRNHIRHVLRELGVHSRLQAVVRGVELGILER